VLEERLRGFYIPQDFFKNLSCDLLIFSTDIPPEESLIVSYLKGGISKKKKRLRLFFFLKSVSRASRKAKALTPRCCLRECSQ